LRRSRQSTRTSPEQPEYPKLGRRGVRQVRRTRLPRRDGDALARRRSARPGKEVFPGKEAGKQKVYSPDARDVGRRRLDLFRRVGALLEGHFRLTSGLHSSGYLQCASCSSTRGRPRPVAPPLPSGCEISRRPSSLPGSRRHRHRAGGGARTRRPGDLRGAPGRYAHAAAAASLSRPTIVCWSWRTSSPRAAPRVRRSTWPGPAARPGWRSVHYRSQWRAERARRAVPRAGHRGAPHLSARVVSPLRVRPSRGEAGFASRVSGDRTLKLVLAYDGTHLVGWQRQAVGDSVQGLLEDALSRFEGGPVTVHGAGRTDAGVHASARWRARASRSPTTRPHSFAP
jgi:hypothetical protein